MQPSTATTSDQAMQNLQSYQQGLQTPEQELTSAQNSLGTGQAQQQVSGLRQAINNTTNLLNQVAPSVQGRTQNSLVTSAQAGKLISNEQAPIQANLSKDTSDYNDANQTYTQLEQQAENEANSGLTAQNNQLSYLQNIYNDLYGKETATASQQAAAAAAATQQQQFQADLNEKIREANMSASAADPTSEILSAILGNQESANKSSASSSGTPSQTSLDQIFSTSSKSKSTSKSPSILQDLGKPISAVGNAIKGIGSFI